MSTGLNTDLTPELKVALEAALVETGGKLLPDTFARRDRKLKGDANPAGIYAAVGAALSMWEAFEHELGELFDVVLYPENSPRAGFIIFMETSGFETRRKIVESVLGNCLPEGELREGVKTLMKWAEQAGGRRNDLAHGRVFKTDGFILSPSVLAGSRRWPKKTAAYQWIAGDVSHYATCFYLLAIEASRLAKAISAQATEIKAFHAKRSSRSG